MPKIQIPDVHKLDLGLPKPNLRKARTKTRTRTEEALNFQHPEVTQVPIDQLQPTERWPRTHNRSQKRKLQTILRTVGFIDPLVIDEKYRILAGHLRWQVAVDVGLKTIPVIQINHLNDVEKRAYALAANRLAEDAGWDRQLLAIELGELAIMLPDANLEIEATGFSISDFDQIIADFGGPSPESAEPELPEAGPSVTRPGDLWRCSSHRIYCADALQSSSFAVLMAGQRATMTFTDPPYNVSILKHARGRAQTKHREFAIASGELTDPEYLHFLRTTFGLIADVSTNGSIVFACIDWTHIRTMLEAGAHAFFELKNVCVWVKSNGGMGTFYRSRHELICAFKVGSAPHINTFELGQHGRSRTNVWEYAGLNAFKSGRDDELAMHPTVKPVRMIADAMLDCSKPQSIVLDPFMGSGSTLLAGEMVGRRVYGLELDPEYVDVAIRRWQVLTGKDAILESTEQTFEDVETNRNAAVAGPHTEFSSPEPSRG